MATRYLCRIIVLQTLYEWAFWNYEPGKWEEIFERNLQEFGQDIDEPDFARRIIRGIVENLEFIDKKIIEGTKSISFENMSILEKNILRLAVYELYFQNPKEVPHKVTINEAIELAKSFSTEGAAKFINGVLGSIYEKLNKQATIPERNQNQNTKVSNNDKKQN
jgi:N utilization substance protein B